MKMSDGGIVEKLAQPECVKPSKEPDESREDGGVAQQDGGRGRRQRQTVHTCTSCNRTFSNRRDVVTHQYMHRENPTAYCTQCSKSFASEAAYRRHAASHSRTAAASARRAGRKTCSQCNIQFDTVRQLSSHHAAKHVDEKRFVCAICGSQFAWPENLRAHQRTHELDPHECDLCGRRFVDATSLRVHMRNAHGPSSEMAAPRKQHFCQVCGRTFQFDFSLRAHMKGHAQSPMAASLRRCKRQVSGPTQTKYVHVDNKGVIDLGVDVAADDCAPTEIMVEVYEPPSASNSTQQTLNFSDVLDQSQMTQLRNYTSADQDHTGTGVLSSSKLVWYVTPEASDNAQPVVRERTDNVQPPAANSQVKPERNEMTVQPPPGAATTDEMLDSAVRQSHDNSATQTGTTIDQDDLAHTDDEADPGNDDDDDGNEDDNDNIDWSLAELPRKRPAPFVYRTTAASRRRATRPREPFLFNCIMTDEKPFQCATCGQSFRWEISLNIHRRLHVDGTFPNKTRRIRGSPSRQPAKPTRAKLKRSPTTASTKVGRSRIVQHRHSSSDEDDGDEFTFHVHADGPTEVSARSYASRRRRPAASASRAATRRGRGAGRGTIASGTVVDRRLVKIQTSPRTAAASCNGGRIVRCSRTEELQSAGEGRRDVASSACRDGERTKRQTRLRAGLVCRLCARVVTSLSALSSHRRRHHCHVVLTCPSCSARFKSQLDLRRHCLTQHTSSTAAVICRQCSRGLTGFARLRQHYALHRAAVKPHYLAALATG